MSDSFNGYHVWLGIPPNEQPPNHYRLLGIAPFETDLDVIDHAADRQMAHVRTFQAGRNAALSQQILNELAAARVCLLNAERKLEYDERLRAKLNPAKATPVLVGKAVPVAKPAAAVPLAAPVAAPVASPVAAPVATRAAAPVAASVARASDARSSDADEIDVDLDGSAPLASRVLDDDTDLLGEPHAAPPTITIRRRGSVVDRDAGLMRSLVYLLVGVVVLVAVMVLYGMVKRMVDAPNWREWFTTPEVPATSSGDPAHVPDAPAPAAPTPAPPSAS
jgi:hypothetical protein